MTDQINIHPSNDNNPQAIQDQGISSAGNIFSILGGLTEPTKKVLLMLGIISDTRHPSIILEELEAKRRAFEVLDTHHNDDLPEREQEAA